MDFNIGFGLWSNDYSHLHNMSLIEDFVQYETTINKVTFDTELGIVDNRTVLPMIPCKVGDFHPAKYESFDDLFKTTIPFFMCLQKSEDITLMSNFDTKEYFSLDIRLVKCTNRPTCKNETEINDFIDKNGAIQMYSNKVGYQTEIYSD